MSRRDEAGYTLVETLIVMFVLSIILTFVYQVLVSTQRNTYAANVRLENLQEGRVLMATITKDLRTAARLDPTDSPFLEAAADEVKFYANLNTFTEPVLVHIYVDANDRIVEEILRPPYAAGTEEIRVVGRYVDDPNVFTYYPADDPDTAAVEPPLDFPLDSSDLLMIEAVEVNLAIRKTTNSSMEPTTLINRVRLPNVDYQPIEESP
jgi:prepilin-type N-terminal cleavage/methylation domain-containing protein